MICGVCKLAIPSQIRKEHLRKYHKIDSHLVDWIIQTDNQLISAKPKIRKNEHGLGTIHNEFIRFKRS
jgi:hypothetical protein